MTFGKEVVTVATLSVGIMLGYMISSIERSTSVCQDSTGKYTQYTAWLAVRDGVHRCFWIQDSYPHRVKLQGVIDVK